MRKRLSSAEREAARFAADQLILEMRRHRRGLKPTSRWLRAWRAMTDLARELYARLGEMSCKGCGCTEDLACEGGCGWTGPEWCSQCAPPSKPPQAKKRRKS